VILEGRYVRRDIVCTLSGIFSLNEKQCFSSKTEPLKKSHLPSYIFNKRKVHENHLTLIFVPFIGVCTSSKSGAAKLSFENCFTMSIVTAQQKQELL